MALQNKGGGFFVIREGGMLCNLKNWIKFSAILTAVGAADFLFANRDGLGKIKEFSQFMGTRDEKFPQKIISHADL